MSRDDDIGPFAIDRWLETAYGLLVSEATTQVRHPPLASGTTVEISLDGVEADL